MPRQKRPPVDVAARRERVWEATCRGLTTRQIARQEEVDHKQIVRDLAAIHEERGAGDAAERAGRLERSTDLARARYRLVVREAMTEWERSKTDKQKRREKAKQKGGGDGGPDETEAEQTTEGRLGDPAYLRAVVAAQTRLDEIDGIDAPKRLAVGGDPDAPPVSTKSEHEHTVDDDLADDLAAIRRILEAGGSLSSHHQAQSVDTTPAAQ